VVHRFGEFVGARGNFPGHRLDAFAQLLRLSFRRAGLGDELRRHLLEVAAHEQRADADDAGCLDDEFAELHQRRTRRSPGECRLVSGSGRRNSDPLLAGSGAV
jgi:hypothetical protein